MSEEGTCLLLGEVLTCYEVLSVMTFVISVMDSPEVGSIAIMEVFNAVGLERGKSILTELQSLMKRLCEKYDGHEWIDQVEAAHIALLARKDMTDQAEWN